MSHIIYKYPLPIPECTVRMPARAQILTARMQNNIICLWAQIDEKIPINVYRTFVCLNTGTAFDAHDMRYIATVEATNGIIWHIYEKEQ